MRQQESLGYAVEAEHLVKSFARDGGWRHRQRSSKRALDDVSLRIRDGEMVAIVGLNGSGKSTLIRVLATLTIPDSGRARIFGNDVVRQGAAVRRQVNRVSVEASFFKEMSPWENLSYAVRLYGRNAKGLRDDATAALRRLGLPRAAMHRPMKQLSRGQQQKVAIARSLLTSPMLLLMDEPTTGLDPRSKREVQSFVSSIHAETGATVLVCTHDLAEAEALCDRVIVIDRGRVLADATPERMRIEHAAGGSLEDAFLRLTGKSFEDDSEDEEPDNNNENHTADEAEHEMAYT